MWACTTLGMAVACNSLLEGALYAEAQCLFTSSDAFSAEIRASIAQTEFISHIFVIFLFIDPGGRSEDSFKIC